MSYFEDQTRGLGKKKRDQTRVSVLSDTTGRNASDPLIKFYELEPAQVVDVISDEDHPDFNGFPDIGKVKFRFLFSDTNRPEEHLPYALPMESSVREFPLPDEIVIVAEYMGDFFYTKRLNVFNALNNNIVDNLTLTLPEKEDNKENVSNYKRAERGYPNSQEDQEDFETFERSNGTVHPVKVSEGDKVVYGRFGNYIKFGNNPDNNRPHLKFVAGQNPNRLDEDPMKPLPENINEDESSFWLTTEEDVDLDPSTSDMEEHLRSFEEPPETYEGRQAILNTDRILLNAKSNEIFAFASNGLGFTSGDQIAIDSKEDMKFNSSANFNLTVGSNTEITSAENITYEAGNNYSVSADNNLSHEVANNWDAEVTNQISFEAKKMQFGDNDAQPIPKGQDTNDLLVNFLNALINNASSFSNSPAGPTQLNPAIVQALTRLKTRLQTGENLSNRNSSQ